MKSSVIYIVGTGPGDEEFLTGQARAAIDDADVVVGYVVYVDLLRKIWPDKEYQTTGMTREIERCRLCYDLAKEGKRVALVCSGDAGVYGMASPMFELLADEERANPGAAAEEGRVELCVVPGITAANSGAAVLGAPLNHDYCVISLSDLMTPWTTIEKRLAAAISGDFAIAIYNPSSRRRADYLQRACDIMLASGASPDRACGYVEQIGRDGTKATVCTLAELRDRQVNMFTTVFVGNSTTFIYDGKLVTPRGYAQKYAGRFESNAAGGAGEETR